MPFDLVINFLRIAIITLLGLMSDTVYFFPKPRNVSEKEVFGCV